jgi:zinc protease
MAFNGTKHFKKNELISYLQSIGVAFGADLNAYTSFDETVYILPIPTDKKENLEKGFLVLEDWAHGVQMKDEDIDAERNIVLEEARLGKGAGDRISKKIYPALFNGSRYAERLPIGKEDILKSFKPEAIKRFYNDWYRPNLMAIIVVGDVEPDQAESMIKAHFEHLTNPKDERPRFDTTVLPFTKSNALVITDPEITTNLVSILFPYESTTPNETLADVRLGFVQNLIFDMFTERLNDVERKPNPPFAGGVGRYDQIMKGFENFSLSAGIGPNGTKAAINALIAEYTRALQHGFSEAELRRAKKNTLRQTEEAYKERNKTDSTNFVDNYVQHFLNQQDIYGIENEYKYAKAFLPAISISEINRAVKKTLPEDRQKITFFIGSSKDQTLVPSEYQLMEMVTQASNKHVAAHTEKILPTRLMSKPPTAGSIVSESKDQALGLTYLRLSNGLNVILKPSDFKNDEVLMSASRYGGQSLFSDADALDAQFSTSIVASMGLGAFSLPELGKITAGRTSTIHTDHYKYHDGLSGSSSSADIELMLQMLTLRMSTIHVDRKVFNSNINEWQHSAKNTRAVPESAFYEFMTNTIYNYHPRMKAILDPKDYQSISLQRSMDIYRSRFFSAKGFTFIFAGSFEVEKIKPLLATYLASLPTSDIPTMYKDLGIRPIKGVVKKEFNAGKEQKSRVSITFTGEVNYSQKERELIDVAVAVLNNKITEILREKLSLIYSGGASLGISNVPYDHYKISVSLPCAPENVDKVIAALFAEIDKMKTEGVKTEDLDKVKQNYMQAFNISLKTNQKWVSHLEEMVTNDVAPDSIITYEDRLKSMTPEQMTEKIKQYFNMKNYVQLVLNPEKPSN